MKRDLRQLPQHSLFAETRENPRRRRPPSGPLTFPTHHGDTPPWQRNKCPECSCPLVLDDDGFPLPCGQCGRVWGEDDRDTAHSHYQPPPRRRQTDFSFSTPCCGGGEEQPPTPTEIEEYWHQQNEEFLRTCPCCLLPPEQCRCPPEEVEAECYRIRKPRGNPSYAYDNPRRTDVIAVHIPKMSFALGAARAWVRDHGFDASNSDATVNFYRFRQRGTKGYQRVFTKTLPNAVQLIIGVR